MNPTDRRATLRAAFYIVSVLGLVTAAMLLLSGKDEAVWVGSLLLLWIGLSNVTVLVEGGSTLFGWFPKPEEPTARKEE